MQWLAVTWMACARSRESAPAELDQMLLASWRDWEDAARVEDNVADLADWLAREGRTEAAWDGLRVANLDGSAVATVDVPDDLDLSAHRGAATAFQSDWPAVDHARLAVAPDQSWTDPSTFERYDREIIEGDPDGFSSGSGLLRTRNTIEKSGAFGILIPYALQKDYRWTEAGDAILIRWWLFEPGCSDNGKNCVLQSFGLDVLVDRERGAERLLVNWIEVVTEADAFLSEDARIGLITAGNQDLMLATEEALGGDARR